ncbi:hypothetical protein [Pseudonocardia spinosispora]|uniref:hypothetical protein n=1 Tax=Pseudonocardia spinosispora TaxID=103441 RepID=UPI000428559B|nr:hypothetical protein [Pseudonocardia spinosispora]
MRQSHALLSMTLAVAAALTMAPDAHAEGDLGCTTRTTYNNGVNVRNTCDRQIAVRVVWSNPSWVTDCWRIDPYLTRPFPKPKPTSQYQATEACTPRG